VLGAGPGGYTAAFRAADLGLKVTLVERSQELGACASTSAASPPSIAARGESHRDAHEMSGRGIAFGAPQIDLPRLRAWKSTVVAS